MIRPIDVPRLDAALKDLRNMLDGLGGTEDRPRARKNGRARALTALRRVRLALDATYPTLKVARGQPRRLLTARGRLDRLRRDGWKDVFGDSDAAKFASAGVRVRRIVVEHAAPGTASTKRTYYFVPAWAHAIGSGHSTALREAKRSKKLRDAALAAEALR
jgi:hypothetical protein